MTQKNYQIINNKNLTICRAYYAGQLVFSYNNNKIQYYTICALLDEQHIFLLISNYTTRNDIFFARRCSRDDVRHRTKYGNRVIQRHQVKQI